MFFLKFAARVGVNAGALWLADRLFEGFTVLPHTLPLLARFDIESAMQTLLVGGVTLALLFGLVRPIVRFFSFPLIFLTLGAFDIVISVILIALADRISGGIEVTGFIAYLGGAVIIGSANALVHHFFRSS